MATKKKDNNKKWNLTKVVEVPGIDVAQHQARSQSLHRTAALAANLSAVRPGVMDERLAAAAARLEDGEQMARAAIHRVVDLTVQPVGVARNDMLLASTGVTGVLATHQSSASSDLAKRATEVREEVFGRARVELQKLRPTELWSAMEMVRERVESSPERRARLESLVQPEAVALMLEAHAKLGRVLGVRGHLQRVPGIDVRGVVAHVNRCIDHYATCVMATATPGDLAAIAQAEAALEPLRALRGELRRGRKVAPAPEEEQEIAEEVEVAPAATSPDPPEPVTEEAPATD